ncbi:MAG: hypothetical protein IT318_03245 [Anaerolineales bacterium]|nr:hypothetical protein [Anaerolineales bacterium]
MDYLTTPSGQAHKELLAGAETKWEAALVDLIEHPEWWAELAGQAQALAPIDWMFAPSAASWGEVYRAILHETPGARAARLQAKMARTARDWQRTLVAQAEGHVDSFERSRPRPPDYRLSETYSPDRLSAW